jgi:cell division transport system permease protein
VRLRPGAAIGPGGSGEPGGPGGPGGPSGLGGAVHDADPGDPGNPVNPVNPVDPASVDALGAALRRADGVADVRYDRQWLDRLLSAVAVIRGAGLLLGTILTLAAALTVANVVRLALYARRDELDIMQLVGAPPAYVRGPFIMEGVLQGGIGALAAVVALGAAFVALRGRYLVPLASAVNLSSVSFLPLEACVLLVAGGMVVGCLGGLVAATLTES